MQGRVHLYEGYTAAQTAVPIRLMRLMGAENLILTNAAGGINKNLNPGDFMIIEDHISSFVPSPLTGKNDESLGVRFPDMSNVYDKELIKLIKSAAAECGINIKKAFIFNSAALRLKQRRKSKCALCWVRTPSA